MNRQGRPKQRKDRKTCGLGRNFLPSYPEVNEANIEEILQQEIGKVFVHVLEDAGVYKCTEEGRASFQRFIRSL